jgi:iron complex outermembrane receptor protein
MPFKCCVQIAVTFSLLSLTAPSNAQEKEVKDSIKTINLATATVVGNEPAKIKSRSINRKELDLIQSRTLGETMSHVPGIQNSYFGPNSGAPVIRSLSGNRVKVLSNGLSVNDLSGMSPNLNINVDMENLLGIDIYKGNASVLYGGKAIGGAINMKDNTIPASLFSENFNAKVLTEGGTNSGTRQAVDLNGNIKKNWAWHIGAMNQSNKDLRIPGNTKAPIAYDPKIDHLTQSLAQVHVDSETIRNLSLYPYLSQFVLTYMNDPKWGLSEADLYTLQENSVIGGMVVPNPRNDKYIAGQDPNTPFSTTIIKGIRDYAPVTKGIMPNSHAENRAVNFGTSYIGKNFYVGAGYRGQEGYFGIPGFALDTKPKHTHDDSHDHDHDHSHDHLTPELQYAPINTRSRSNTMLLAAELNPEIEVISLLKLNYLQQLAEDRELVGLTEVNKFNTKRHTLRTELEQQTWKFLKGTTGFDFSRLEMIGEGTLRYLPNNLSREIGLFSVQRIDLTPVQINAGYRHDWVARRAMPDETYKPSRGLAGGKLSPKDFNLNHYNTDVLWTVFDVAYLKGSFIHAERAPEVNELYAGNDHFAIMIEENGDDRLNKETANTYELEGGINYKGLRLATTYYRTNFKNYMYLAHTGFSRAGGFLVKEWRASDTRITGWEAELSYKSSWGKGGTWGLASFFDLVKNENTSDDHLRRWAEGDFMPNLPTSRYGVSTAVGINKIDLNISFDRYLEQRNLGKNINPEPPMPAYSLLAAKFAYKTTVKKLGIEYYVFGNNLLHVEARPQNSFLKYLAPLPGRNISLGIKVVI